MLYISSIKGPCGQQDYEIVLRNDRTTPDKGEVKRHFRRLTHVWCIGTIPENADYFYLTKKEAMYHEAVKHGCKPIKIPVAFMRKYAIYQTNWKWQNVKGTWILVENGKYDTVNTGIVNHNQICGAVSWLRKDDAKFVFVELNGELYFGLPERKLYRVHVCENGRFEEI